MMQMDSAIMSVVLEHRFLSAVAPSSLQVKLGSVVSKVMGNISKTEIWPWKLQNVIVIIVSS